MESIGDIDSSSFYGVLGMKVRLEKAQEETGREDTEIVGVDQCFSIGFFIIISLKSFLDTFS